MSQLPIGEPAEMQRWAQLTPCGTYRYLLGRRWGHGPALRWVMLNPSTADAEVDDPTIRRVIGFSHASGYRCAVIANLFALRATDPSSLRRHAHPVGPDNDQVLRRVAFGSLLDAGCHDTPPLVVAAWGAGAPRARVQAAVAALFPVALVCLGTTKHGQPRHPLYVASHQQLIRWDPAPFAADTRGRAHA